MEHELKTWPVPFQAVLDGTKTYEFRRNDRNFTVGDRLWLREWDNVGEAYTGRSVMAEVSYMTAGAFGVPEGFCVLALKDVVRKTCGSCGNQCMDMSMDPYCNAPQIRADWPIGKNLCRGRPEQCGPEGKLWVLDTRREKKGGT